MKPPALFVPLTPLGAKKREGEKRKKEVRGVTKLVMMFVRTEG